MKYARVYSVLSLQSGHGFHKITAETTIRRGIPNFAISGMSKGSSKDTSERVRSALSSSGLESPYMAVHVNLFPADLRKRGASLDLPVAVSVMAAADPNLIDQQYLTPETIFIGELTISGEILPVRGLPAMISRSAENGIRTVITSIPEDFHPSSAGEIRILHADSLSELFQLIHSPAQWHTHQPVSSVKAPDVNHYTSSRIHLIHEFQHLRFSEEVLSAAEMAASGWHSLLMVGPPGTGKSSLAVLLHRLLPDPDPAESQEILAAMHMFADSESASVNKRPFRSPHHSVSAAGLIGGGTPPVPGEITRAHKGILFLDEMAEFHQRILQDLREPMQNHFVKIARFAESVSLPSDFLLVGAANPCPCGYLGDPVHSCSCTAAQTGRYRSRLAGPLRDRIDIEIRVVLTENGVSFSENNLHRIETALKMQEKRYRESDFRFNGQVPADAADRFLQLREETEKELRNIIQSRGLSHRKILSVRRMARTCADLAGSTFIRVEDIRKAACFLDLDDIWIH